jgi:hypothetical protein
MEDEVMWRAFFLAVGATLCILGVECLGVQEVVLKARVPTPKTETNVLGASSSALGPQRKIVPPDYAPWSLLGLGAVVILYAYDVPRRLQA